MSHSHSVGEFLAFFRSFPWLEILRDTIIGVAMISLPMVVWLIYKRRKHKGWRWE